MAPLNSSQSKPHIVLFPFMSKGHIIPLLHLARLLFHRGVRVSIFTTPANRPFIVETLSGTDVSVIDLPFPENVPGIPPGTESTDKLPSMSLFVPFANSTKLMQPFFEKALEDIHNETSCIISDGFLPWTLQSASRFGIPRLSFYGMSNYAIALSHDASTNSLLPLHESPDEPFTLPSFPWISLTRNDFDTPWDKRDPSGPHLDAMIEMFNATTNSFGLLVNSFYELEKLFADFCNTQCQPKYWNVGPLCLAQPSKTRLSNAQKPDWLQWLDNQLSHNSPVLYVAFGSQAKMSSGQLNEIAVGLEESKVSFLWVLRKSGSEVDEINNGFEERVKGRGMVVKDWVDQREILKHDIVQGFLSHCGWNSVLEGICAEVPILAWPMMAEQWLNAKMVADEIKVGLRVKTVNGSAKGFVKRDSLKDSVIELMESEKGKELRVKVKVVAQAARNAVGEGGSSWNALNDLIAEVCRQKQINSSKLAQYRDQNVSVEK